MIRLPKRSLASHLKTKLVYWKGQRTNHLHFLGSRPSFSTDLGPNPGLASVISQGIRSLEESAADIATKTRNQSLDLVQQEQANQHNRPRQLAEGQRILEIATECLEDALLSNNHQAIRSLVSLSGEPIVLLDAEVSKDLKQAKVFWALPYSVLLDEEVTPRIYHHLRLRMNENLVERGGANWLSGQVHSRLSSYYPPRLKLVPASDEMVQLALREYFAE